MPQKHGPDLPPERRTVVDHWLAIVDPLDGLLPIMKGALRYSPCSLVDSSPLGEPLNEMGRHFLRFVLIPLELAINAADEAAGRLPGTEPFAAKAQEAYLHLVNATLLAYGLKADISDTLPCEHALRKLRKELKAARKAIGDNPERSHAGEAKEATHA